MTDGFGGAAYVRKIATQAAQNAQYKSFTLTQQQQGPFYLGQLNADRSSAVLSDGSTVSITQILGNPPANGVCQVLRTDTQSGIAFQKPPRQVWHDATTNNKGFIAYQGDSVFAPGNQEISFYGDYRVQVLDIKTGKIYGVPLNLCGTSQLAAGGYQIDPYGTGVASPISPNTVINDDPSAWQNLLNYSGSQNYAIIADVQIFNNNLIITFATNQVALSTPNTYSYAGNLINITADNNDYSQVSQVEVGWAIFNNFKLGTQIDPVYGIYQLKSSNIQTGSRIIDLSQFQEIFPQPLDGQSVSSAFNFDFHVVPHQTSGKIVLDLILRTNAFGSSVSSGTLTGTETLTTYASVITFTDPISGVTTYTVYTYDPPLTATYPVVLNYTYGSTSNVFSILEIYFLNSSQDQDVLFSLTNFFSYSVEESEPSIMQVSGTLTADPYLVAEGLIPAVPIGTFSTPELTQNPYSISSSNGGDIGGQLSLLSSINNAGGYEQSVVACQNNPGLESYLRLPSSNESSAYGNPIFYQLATTKSSVYRSIGQVWEEETDSFGNQSVSAYNFNLDTFTSIGEYSSYTDIGFSQELFPNPNPFSADIEYYSQFIPDTQYLQLFSDILFFTNCNPLSNYMLFQPLGSNKFLGMRIDNATPAAFTNVDSNGSNSFNTFQFDFTTGQGKIVFDYFSYAPQNGQVPTDPTIIDQATIQDFKSTSSVNSIPFQVTQTYYSAPSQNTSTVFTLPTTNMTATKGLTISIININHSAGSQPNPQVSATIANIGFTDSLGNTHQSVLSGSIFMKMI